MTLATFTLFAVTGSLLFLKLALMALAAVLLAKMLFTRRPPGLRPQLARRRMLHRAHHG